MSKYILCTYTSYKVLEMVPPSACRDACTCLILFANKRGKSVWGMFVLNVRSAIRHNNPDAYVIMRPRLWNGRHMALNIILCLSLEFILRKPVSLYQHSTSAGSRTHARIYRQMRLKQHTTVTTSQPVLQTKYILIQEAPGFDPWGKSARVWGSPLFYSTAT
jgi:hypothetical protein